MIVVSILYAHTGTLLVGNLRKFWKCICMATIYFKTYTRPFTLRDMNKKIANKNICKVLQYVIQENKKIGKRNFSTTTTITIFYVLFICSDQFARLSLRLSSSIMYIHLFRNAG